eukprot:331271_1
MFEILQYCYKYGSWNTSLVTTSTNQEPLFLHQTTSDFVNQINYTQIKSWLESIGMVQYYESFITNNYESKEDIIKIKTKQQLQNIGISLKGHQTKMLADIRRLQKQCTKKNNQKRFHKINKRPKDDISDDEMKDQKMTMTQFIEDLKSMKTSDIISKLPTKLNALESGLNKVLQDVYSQFSDIEPYVCRGRYRFDFVHILLSDIIMWLLYKINTFNLEIIFKINHFLRSLLIFYKR